MSDFLNKYLKFEKNKIYAPISLNIYETNYAISDKVPSIMSSYGMRGYTNEHKFPDFSIWERTSKKGHDVFKGDICFEAYNYIDNIDRSANIYIYTKSDKKDLFLVEESLINIYILILNFYKNIEFSNLITNERKNIFSIYSKGKNRKTYNYYKKFINNILLYQTLLDNLVSVNHNYSNEYIKNSRKYQLNISNKLLDECKKFEKYFSNKLAIDNLLEIRKLSYISIIIALLSLLVAIIPIIYNNYHENNIEENIKKETYTLNKINKNIIEVKEEIKEIVKKDSEK